MNPRQASLTMVTAACLWGTHPTLIKLAAWTPYGTAWVRGVSCAIVLGLFIAFTRSFSRQSFGIQALCGVFLAINSLLFVNASALTSPANAVILMFSFPWITMAMDYSFRGIRPQRSDLLRLLIGLAGIIIIVQGGINHTSTLGDICALLAGLSIALHIFFSQKLNRRHQGNKEILSSMMLGWIFTCVALLPFTASSALPNATQTVYLGLFGLLSALPWLLWGISIAYIPGHVVAALLGVEVVVAAFIGWLVLGEAPDLSTWVGGTLTLVAAMSQILSSNRHS